MLKESRQKMKQVLTSIPRWLWCLSFVLLMYAIMVDTTLTFIVNYAFSKRDDPVCAHIEKIELHLLKKSFVLRGAKLIAVKTRHHPAYSILDISSVQWNWSWLHMLHAGVQGDLNVQAPRVKLDKSWLAKKGQKSLPSTISDDAPGTKTEDILEQYQLIQKAWSNFVPFRVSSVDIQDIRVDYVDTTTEPKISMTAGPLNLHVENITNRPDAQNAQNARAKLTGKLPGNADLTLDLQFNPASSSPRLRMQVHLKTVDLTAYNDVLRGYAELSLLRGDLALTAEISAQDGHYRGFARPVLKNVDVKVLPTSGGTRSLKNFAWRGLWAGASSLLNLDKQKSVLPKVAIEGDFKNPQMGLVDAVSTLCFQMVAQIFKPGVLQDAAQN